MKREIKFLDLDQYNRDRFDREYHFYKKIPQLKTLNKSIKKVIIRTNKITQKIELLSFMKKKKMILPLQI